VPVNKIYLAGQMIGQWSDRTGSVRYTVSGSAYSHYYPFGEEITSTPNDTYKYARLYRDSDTGLDYAKNRFYAAALGRFLTPDKKGTSAHPNSPQSWNRYAYVTGDPANRRDPKGLDGGGDDSDSDEALFGAGGDMGEAIDEQDQDAAPVESVTSTFSTPDKCPEGTAPSSDGMCNDVPLNSNAQTVGALINEMNPGGFINASAALIAGGAAIGAATAVPALVAAGAVAATVAASPAGQQVVVNIGGALEGPGNAIILQTGQIGGSTAVALENAAGIASQTGQQVVIGSGDAIPFATGSVNQVIINNVPIGTGSGYFGPYIDPSEIVRILAPGGTVTGTSAGDFFSKLGQLMGGH
jgi:RHS repeat-associated protein